MRNQTLVFAALADTLLAAQSGSWAQNGAPGNGGVLRFAVIGDNGDGGSAQYEVGQQMAMARATFPFALVFMLRHNLYGRQQPSDFVDRFERPYAPLLQAGIPFYATLGNHDNPSNRFYPCFNMRGEGYNAFVRRPALLRTGRLGRKTIPGDRRWRTH